MSFSPGTPLWLTFAILYSHKHTLAILGDSEGAEGYTVPDL